VDDRAPSVGDLVARFQLRRRASTEAFRTGVRLVRSGDVTVISVAAESVHAEVRDRSLLAVELYVDDSSLVGRCPCSAAEHGICGHQVAVAHAVWVDLRRHRGRGVGDTQDERS
jgi:uncharacterized Zn finger protein